MLELEQRVTIAQIPAVIRPLWGVEGVIASIERPPWNSSCLYHWIMFDKPVDVGIDWVDPKRQHLEHWMSGVWLRQEQIAGFE